VRIGASLLLRVPRSKRGARRHGCEIARWDALAPMFKIVVG
jgi:hypothetical protein